MVNKKQFGRMYADRFNSTYRDSEDVCDKVFELLGILLYEKNEDVVISGFGSLRHKTAKQKRVRHPSTGELITMPERDVIKFTPSEAYENKD